MKVKKVAIVHFQPLEKYPPAMNLINEIASEKKLFCTVFSTTNGINNWFNKENVCIKRTAIDYKKSYLKYWGYIKFNLNTFLKLLSTAPQNIIVFETYSILPVYLYTIFFKKKRVIIYHHEYVSLQEIEVSSLYQKYLIFCEKKVYRLCDYVSQTNEQRAELFLQDVPFLYPHTMLVSPNLPPKEWYEFAKKNKTANKGSTIKMVHVGALSLDTMYIKEIVNWVVAQNGKYSIDFYTDNITIDAKKYLNNINCKDVRLLGGVNYFQLPQVLVNYDIGLTLYNGHIPNYIYNVPNKVLEYLACGLNVLYSKDLISTTLFIDKYLLKGCYASDFINMDGQFIQSAISKAVFNENFEFYNLLDMPKTIISKILLAK